MIDIENSILTGLRNGALILWDAFGGFVYVWYSLILGAWNNH